MPFSGSRTFFGRFRRFPDVFPLITCGTELQYADAYDSFNIKLNQQGYATWTADAASFVNFNYDSNTLLQSVLYEDSSGNTFSYDDKGSLIKIDQPGSFNRTVNYTYDYSTEASNQICVTTGRWVNDWYNFAAIVGWLMLEIGWAAFLLVEVPILLIACGAGVWLFYVQHNFDPTYWERHAEWDFFNAGMDGSSFYKLPKVLQWFTGNIGFHHIHHLSPRIPNYKLEECHNENPIFQIEPLTFRKSLKSLFFRLWDEKEKTLVGWSALKKYRTQNVKVKI